MNAKLLNIKEVQELIGVRRSALYKWWKAGYFPRPCHLSARCIRWPLDEVLAWIEARRQAREG